MAVMVVWNKSGQAAYTLNADETLTQPYISLHPLGAFLLGLGGVVTNVIATVDNLDGSEYTFYKLATLTEATCQCRNTVISATWTQMQ